MHNTRYEDFGSPARDVAELWLLYLMELAERAEQTAITRHPVIAVSQKSACAYEVYARMTGLYHSGFV